jgi:hypothetical protein
MVMLVRHASKYIKDYGTGIIVSVFETKKVNNTCIKRFFNNMHKTASLSPASRNLIDYMVEHMNRDNEIENSQLFKMEFTEFMKKTCSINYTGHTVNKGFQALKKADILISFDKMRGVYILNPLYFFKGSEIKRKALLQKMLNATPNGKYSCTNLKRALGV